MVPTLELHAHDPLCDFHVVRFWKEVKSPRQDSIIWMALS